MFRNGMLAALFSENMFIQGNNFQTRRDKSIMKRKKNYHWNIRVLLLCAVVCVTSLIGNSVKAEASQNSGMDYSIKPVMPENQRGETQAYFDLLMEPGGEQTLQVEITNHGEEDKIINVSVATASTDNSGIAVYGVRSGVETDDSLLYRMEDLVSTEGRITVAPGETYTVNLKVLVPSTSFDGILAGGINFQEIVEEGAAEATTEGGVTIINEYSYVIALLLRVNETEIQPDLRLNKVSAAQTNWRNVISANIQNFQPAYVTGMSTVAKVRKSGAQEVLYEGSGQQMNMAPNSNFNYKIPLSGAAFEAGDYILTLEVDSNEGSWSFEQEFTITAEEARAFNETDVTIERSNLWLYVLIGAGILFVVFLIFILVLYKKRRKKQKVRLTEILAEIISRIKGNG